MVSRRRGAPFPARPGALRPRRGRSAPAELQPLGGVDRLEALPWLVGDELHASVEELEARGGLRLLAGLGELHHRLHALRCHEQRVLLRGRADDAGLDILHARAAAVDRDHEHAAVGLARRLKGLVGAGRRRLVDRVDHVDARVLLQEGLHAGAPALVGALGPEVADDALVVLVQVAAPVLWVDAEPLMKPWSRATSTVGWFSSASRKATWAVLVLAPSVLAAHSPMSRPALKLSVAKVASAASMGSSGVSRAMTRMPASRAFFTVGTMALVSLGVMRMPLAPAEMRFSMAATCVSLSPSNLPAKLCTRAPTFLAVASAPSRILTKKGLLSVLVMRPMKTSAALAGPAVPATRTATAASSQIADLEWSVMISSGKPRAPNPLPGGAAASLQAAALFGKPPCGEAMPILEGAAGAEATPPPVAAFVCGA